MARYGRVYINGIGIDNVTMADIVSGIDSYIRSKDPSYIVTPNIDHMVKLHNDPEFRMVYEGASLVLPDGMPLLWAARFLGASLKERVSGSDLFPELCRVASEKGYRLFFLGGREGAAAKAADVLRARYPSIQITGVYFPPFGFENDAAENERMVEAIKSAKPDILFVGLGAPKQEKWIYKYRDRCGVPVSIGIGVSFEFVAGMVRRAPVWMRRCGLEWSWRLMMEPKRLWKRYLVDDMQFFWLVLKQKLSRKDNGEIRPIWRSIKR